MLFADDRQDSVYYHYSPNYKYSIGIEMIDAQEQAKTMPVFGLPICLIEKTHAIRKAICISNPD